MRLTRRLWLSALFAALPLGALAVEIPTRKPGLWEVKMTTGDGRMAGITAQHCTDTSTDKEMNSTFGPVAAQMCSKNDIEKTSTGYVVNSVCNVGGKTSVARNEIVGDFNSAYTMKIVSKTEGLPAGMPADSTMTMEAKWVGACKNDQKPGDIIMPGGIKMNVKDLKAGLKSQ